MSVSNGHHRDDAATDDDNDGDYESAAHDAYYHPISAFDDGSAPGSDDDTGGIVEAAASPIRSNGGGLFHLQNPNPSFFFVDAESGISALDLNGGGVGDSGEGAVEEAEDKAAEEEEERVRQLEASISRAFREDERRRSAPLTAENAARVLDAMRGVAFRGVPPEWADQVPEEQWVDRLRRLRGLLGLMRKRYYRAQRAHIIRNQDQES